MKTRKRLLAGFLSLAMCLSLLPGTAWAAFGNAARIKSIAYGELMALPGNRAADSGDFTNSTSAPFIFVFREEDAAVKSVTKDALAAALSSGEGVTVSGQATRVVCLKYTEYSSLSEEQQGYFAVEIRPGTESEYMTSTSEFWSAAPANDIAMTSYLSTYADTLKTNGFDPDNMEPLMKYVGHYNKYVHFAYVYWQKASTTSNTTPKITGADTSQLSLNSKTFNTYNVPVTTENLAGKTLTITETDADGTAKTTSSTGIAISSSATVGTDNTATLTLTTSTGLAGGTYYFKISADGAEDYTFSVDVEQSVTVNLSVTPTAAAGKWELVIQDLTGQSVQKTTAAVVAGEHYSFDLLQSNGTAYGSLTDHPTDGETYSGGSIYMPSMFKVTDSNNTEDDTVLTWTGLANGDPLNRTKITQYVTNIFTAPDHDINVEVEFVKAYPIAMGTVSGWDNYAEAEYPWQYYITNGYYYRPGDTVKDNSLISTIQKKVRNSGYVLKEVTVHKTGDTNTVVYQYLAEDGTDEYFSFTMPEYPVSVSLVYAVDEEPLIASISDQTGTIIDGIASSATFEITTKNITDGAELTIQECDITGAAVSTPTSGLALEVTSVQDNAATVTVKSDGTIKAGTVRFKLLYGDTMLNTIGADVTTIAATVSDSSTKAVVIGTPSGELYAGSAGTLTFAGQVSNISDGSTVTVVETDAAGTPKTTNPTSGLTLSATTVSGKAFTITAETTAAVPQGTYYFKATADNTDSLIIPLTVLAPVYKINSGTYQNGGITISSQSAAEGESITLTAAPHTGYILDTISVTKADGSAVTLSGTGNTRTFTMPASNVTVNATFKEEAAGETTYLVNSATYQNGYVSISKQSAAEDETITLTAQPNTGYALATISVTKTDGSDVPLSGTGNTRTFIMPASDVTVNATFTSSVTTYPVKVSTVPNGTITVSPTEAAEGATVTVTVTPNSGYQMVAGSLKYSEASAGGAVVTISGNTFTMPGIEVSVSCQFEAVTTAPESPVSITSFMINGVSAAINNESRIITIVLPYGTDLSAVAPVITGVNIERIRPDSAQLVDLRSPRTYTVYSTDGTRVSYTVAAYTEDPTPAMQLWENLQDHIDGTDNWWELAEYQKITGYYDNDTSGQTLYSLQTYLDDITAQYGTKRTTLNCYYYGGRLMLEPASYSMSGTSYSNILDFPRKTLSNLSDLGYSIVTYNLRELQVDIYEKMETTKGFEITVSAPSSSIRSAWNKLSGNGRIFEIEASSTKAGLVLRIPVGEVLKSELSLMKYDTTKAKFVEIDRDDWHIQDGYLITTSVSAGIYGLRDR